MTRVMTTTLLVVLLCGAAHAQLVERDWLAPGDGLLTFDPVSGLEWLDFTETLLADRPGALVQDRFDAVLAETGPGQPLEGFRQATVAEAEALLASAGISSVSGVTNDFAEAEALLNLLGPTFTFPGGETATEGILQPENAEGPRSLSLSLLVSSSTPPGTAALAFISVPRDLNTPYSLEDALRGVALVRAAVPEPAAMSIVGLAIAVAFAGLRRD